MLEKNFVSIILAAGEGTRLKKYTKFLPKGMLEFAGKTMIEREIERFRKVGVEDIVIVKGFAQEKINYPRVEYFINEKYNTTNMLVSLFCAEEKLSGDVIVSYSDILFDIDLLSRLIKSKNDIVVSVDTNWKEYWNMRYGRIDYDTESLRLNNDDRILSLGIEDPPVDEIDARYVGLLKFSSTGVEDLKKVWHKYKKEFWGKPWQVSGKPLRNAYLTDMLQALIDEGCKVEALKTKNGWIEFDTNEDFEKAIEWHEKGTLSSLLRIEGYE